VNPQLNLSSFSAAKNDAILISTSTCSDLPDRWAQWFQDANLVALEQAVPDIAEAEALAKLCLQHTETHPEAVNAVLIAHRSVRLQMRELLQAGHADAQLQRSLAQRLLNAGFMLQGDGLSPVVQELIEERNASRDTYWNGKVEQYRNVRECETLVPGTGKQGGFFFGKGRPYFHFNPDYRTFNVNCRILSADRMRLECRHLQLAVLPEQDEGVNEGESRPAKALWNKRVLREISQMDCQDPRSDRLNYGPLERQFGRAKFAPAINFSPERFGVLLRKLLPLSRDLPRSFGVGWLFSHGGHAMRVFMERSTTAPFWVKVGLYEPNVSGDVSHLKVLPEELHRLNFHDFDKLQMCKANGVSVLCLQVDDLELSRACAGLFVKQDVDSQLASLEQGLSACNSPEIKQAIVRLCEFRSFDAPQVARFGRCLKAATAGEGPERLAGFEIFMNGLRSLILTPDQVTEILRDAGPSCGLPWLFTCKSHAPLVEVLMRSLKELKLSPDQAWKVLRGGEMFCLEDAAYTYGVDTTIQIFRAGIKSWGFSAEQLGALLGKNRGDLASKSAGMIATCLTGLQALGLSSDQIARMLTPVPSSWDKETPLSNSLKQWKRRKEVAGSVKAFMAGLHALSLSAEQNLAILAPEHFGGVEGLRKVLDGVAVEACATFLEGLALLDMPAEAREVLMG